VQKTEIIPISDLGRALDFFVNKDDKNAFQLCVKGTLENTQVSVFQSSRFRFGCSRTCSSSDINCRLAIRKFAVSVMLLALKTVLSPDSAVDRVYFVACEYFRRWRGLTPGSSRSLSVPLRLSFLFSEQQLHAEFPATMDRNDYVLTSYIYAICPISDSLCTRVKNNSARGVKRCFMFPAPCSGPGLRI
jgi:hypothetical protein